jgi:predicted ArsR family transcriptional regulator
MQADGLVAYAEVRHGVGRPRLVYSLTDDALDKFPTRYFRLTTRILDELKENLPEEKIDQLFSGVADSMADNYRMRLQGLPLESRLTRIIDLLSEEGFEATLTREGNQALIREMSCPYFRIGREHPEVCIVDQSFIAKALSLPVERVACLLSGDPHCTFAVELQKPVPEVPSHDG